MSKAVVKTVSVNIKIKTSLESKPVCLWIKLDQRIPFSLLVWPLVVQVSK